MMTFFFSCESDFFLPPPRFKLYGNSGSETPANTSVQTRRLPREVTPGSAGGNALPSCAALDVLEHLTKNSLAGGNANQPWSGRTSHGRPRETLQAHGPWAFVTGQVTGHENEASPQSKDTTLAGKSNA